MARDRGLLLVVFLFAACQAPPVGAPGPAQPRASLEQLQAEGDAHLALRDYDAAVRAYQAAFDQDGDRLAARHGLAVALSHLGRSDEAARMFRWIAEHAPAHSDEARIARQWLGPAAAPPGPVAATQETEAGGGRLGEVRGRTEWPDLDQALARPSLQILLEGEDPATRGRRYWGRVALNDTYRFAGVEPGRYRLRAQVGPIRLWDTTVAVQAAGPTVLDLTAATSVARPDALRPRS
jgi:tetratricopeptide (TPR) repeat protein